MKRSVGLVLTFAYSIYGCGGSLFEGNGGNEGGRASNGGSGGESGGQGGNTQEYTAGSSSAGAPATGGSTTKGEATGTCELDGVKYNVGDVLPKTDCNSCTCGTRGAITCTTLACLTPCERDGTTYSVGDTFDLADGCNSCTCTTAGLTCTGLICPSGD